jgi:hypothetical protein
MDFFTPEHQVGIVVADWPHLDLEVALRGPPRFGHRAGWTRRLVLALRVQAVDEDLPVRDPMELGASGDTCHG